MIIIIIISFMQGIYTYIPEAKYVPREYSVVVIIIVIIVIAIIIIIINPLTPNGLYISRTAPLTSKFSFYIFIQQI